MKQIGDVLADIFQDVDVVAEHEPGKGGRNVRSSSIGVGTGYSDLDQILAGLRPSDLAVIVGVSGIGKTSLATGIAYGAAVANEHSVGYFTLQHTEIQSVARLFAMETGVPLSRVIRGQIVDSEWDRISRAFGSLSKAALYIDDSAFSIDDLRSKIQSLQEDQGLELVIVDDLRSIRGHLHSTRWLELSGVVRELKAIATDCHVPILLLAPTAHDKFLSMWTGSRVSADQELGPIDEVADIVALLHREDQFDPDSEKRGVAEIKIVKNRNRLQGTVILRFFDRTARFADLELYPGPRV